MSSPKTIARSLNIGGSAEHRFHDTCKNLGRNIKKASNREDIKHIDFVVDGKTFDVKGLKKTQQNGLLLLEVKNVQGKDGWASKSGPEFVAFDFGGFFLSVLNADLIKLIDKKCRLQDAVDHIDKALYMAYTRKGRDDLMTVVKLQDVLNYCWHEFLPYSEYRPAMEIF